MDVISINISAVYVGFQSAYSTKKGGFLFQLQSTDKEL